MSISDSIPRNAKKKIKTAQRTGDDHIQETSIPCQPLSQGNASITSHNIPPDSHQNINLQYYVQDETRNEDMPERSELLVLAKREAGGRDQLNVRLEKLKLEPEHSEGGDSA